MWLERYPWPIDITYCQELEGPGRELKNNLINN